MIGISCPTCFLLSSELNTTPSSLPFQHRELKATHSILSLKIAYGIVSYLLTFKAPESKRATFFFHGKFPIFLLTIPGPSWLQWDASIICLHPANLISQAHWSISQRSLAVSSTYFSHISIVCEASVLGISHKCCSMMSLAAARPFLWCFVLLALSIRFSALMVMFCVFSV